MTLLPDRPEYSHVLARLALGFQLLLAVASPIPTAGGPWQPAGNFQKLVIAVSAKWFPGCCRVRQMVAWGRCPDPVAVRTAA